MTRIRRSLLSLIVVLCTGSLLHAQSSTTPTTTTPTTTTTPSTTGVLIYELNFEHLAGFNIDFWKGGYVVVPGIGGTGTVVLTGKNDFGGKIFRQFASSAYFFQAKRKNGRSSIIQMTGGTIGTASPLVSMQAFGDVSGSITLESPTFTLRVDAAKSLHGLALASLDESLLPGATTTTTGTGTTAVTTTIPSQKPTDGTLGYIEFAEMKLDLDSGKTEKANKAGLGVSDAVTTEVINVLKLKGYLDASSTSTGTTGGTTGGTTTTPTGGTGGGGA